jgi:hypothetical protein
MKTTQDLLFCASVNDRIAAISNETPVPVMGRFQRHPPIETILHRQAIDGSMGQKAVPLLPPQA